jgi:small subunit ribosomal protein S1
MTPDDPSEDFAALLEEYERSEGKKKRDPKVGEEVRGRVLSIGRDAVFLDLGTKSDGMIEIAELRDADGKLTVEVGDTVEGRVVEVGGKHGCVVIRRLMGRLGPEALADLEQARAHGIPVEGQVTAVNKGGVEVTVAGTRAFCPMSQLDLRPVGDAAALVGQRLAFRITKLERGPRGLDLVLSRRALLEEEQQARADQTRGHLAIGAVMTGKVTALKDFGAFVDLGGIEGLIHLSELSFQRVAHPKDVLGVGQEVEVQVKRIEKTDDPRQPERVALSLKSLERDPWLDATERFPEGARLPGVVARLETFGAFVELAAGVEGLVHLSELGTGKKNVRHPREVVKIGQTVQVTVLSVDPKQRRISLSMADLGDGGEAGAAPADKVSLGTFADLLKK